MKRLMLCILLLTGLPLFADLDKAWRVLVEENQYQRARLLFERALEEGEDPTLARIGWYLTFTGDGPTPDLQQAAMQILEENPDSEASEYVLKHLYALRDSFGDWIEKAGPILQKNPPQNPENKILASQILRLLASYQGDRTLFLEAGKDSGLLNDWYFSEIFGTQAIPAFDRSWPAESPEYWESPLFFQSDNGLVMPPAALPGSGVLYAFSAFENPSKQSVSFRIFSFQNITVYLDGRTLFEALHRETIGPNIHAFSVNLPKGRHELMVKITQSRSQNGQFSLQLHAAKAPQPLNEPSPQTAINPKGKAWTVTPRSIGLEAHLAKQDQDLARFIYAVMDGFNRNRQDALLKLESLWESYPQSQLIGQALSTIYLNLEPYLSQEYQLGRAFRMLLNLGTGEQAKLENKLNLALILVQANKVKEALETLRQIVEDNPQYTDALDALNRLAEREKLHDLSSFALERIEDLGPTHRWGQRYLYQQVRKQGNLEQTRELLQNLAQLMPWEGYQARLYEMNQEYEAAIEDFKTRWEFFKDRDLFPESIAELYARLGNQDQQRHWLEETLSSNPTNRKALLNLVNLDCLEGVREQAIERIREYLKLEPSDGDFRRRLSHLEGRTAFESFRVDTTKIIADWLKKPTTQGADSELILDQLMVRIFPDGSQMRYTHLIRRVLTKDGVDQESEIQLPGQDLEILQLRTIKQDGAVLYPENIAHKSTISLSGLGVGDFIDEEHIEYLPPASYDPDGLDASMSFVFQGIDRVYHHSELVLIYPEDLEPAPVLIDQNMPSPATHTVENGMHVVRWLALNMPPITPEPAMPATIHFQPAATAYFNTTWLEVRDFYRHAVRSRMGLSQRTLDQIETWRNTGKTGLELATHIFNEVVDAIEPQRDFYQDANLAWETKQGNATLLLAAIYQELGFPTEIILTRPLEGANISYQVPIPDGFAFPLIRTNIQGETYWLDANTPGLPFTYVPQAFRGSDGLAITGSDDVLIEIPKFDNQSERIESNYVITLKADGSAVGKGSESFFGQFAATLDRNYDTMNNMEIKQRVEAGINVNFPGATVSEAEVAEGLPRGEFSLKNAFSHSNLAKVTNQGLEVPYLLPKNPMRENYAELARREYPVHIRRPHINVSHLEVVLPTAMEWRVETKDIQLKTEFGTYNLKITLKDDQTLIIDRDYHIPPQLITPERYSDFQAFCSAMLEKENLRFEAGNKAK